MSEGAGLNEMLRLQVQRTRQMYAKYCYTRSGEWTFFMHYHTLLIEVNRIVYDF